MEPENDGLEDDFPLHLGDFLGSMFKSSGVYPKPTDGPVHFRAFKLSRNSSRASSGSTCSLELVVIFFMEKTQVTRDGPRSQKDTAIDTFLNKYGDWSKNVKWI